MKTTKELKEALLRGFEGLVDELWVSESWAEKYENEGDEQKRDYWREKRRTCERAILKGIESLIEVERE